MCLYNIHERSFDHCYIKKFYFFCIFVYYKTLPSSRQFLKRRGRKHARQVPPRNCGIAISRKARARQNARLPPRHPPPYSNTVEFVGAEQREIYRRTEPFSDAIHRVQVGRTWQSRELIGLAFKLWARFPFRISLPPPPSPLYT